MKTMLLTGIAALALTVGPALTQANAMIPARTIAGSVQPILASAHGVGSLLMAEQDGVQHQLVAEQDGVQHQMTAEQDGVQHQMTAEQDGVQHQLTASAHGVGSLNMDA